MSEPISNGFRTVTPHLVVKGAAEAIEFYKEAFGATERFRMPMAGADGVMKVGHAEITIGDSIVMVNDEYPDHGVFAPQGPSSPVTIHLQVPDVDARFQRALDAGARAIMPPADMFWGDRYGKLADPFGHHWSIATKVEDVTPELLNERMAAMIASGETCSTSDADETAVA